RTGACRGTWTPSRWWPGARWRCARRATSWTAWAAARATSSTAGTVCSRTPRPTRFARWSTSCTSTRRRRAPRPQPDTRTAMKLGVLLLNFGEPENPTMEEVVPFLERIFTLNAPLMGAEVDPERVRERSKQLAEARAPGLIEEYREIGGSPLMPQAREQGELLEAELRGRGHDVVVLLGMQFTAPSIEEAVARARELGVERLVALPVYPLAGPSTTVASLDAVHRAVADFGWSVPVASISGWHRHPAYTRMRADAIREVLARSGLSFDDPGTRMVFSAHGTPMKYIEEGNGYDVYVRDFCASVARELGVDEYVIGYQNHTNRP